jgi:prepilin-type N-terminal cleavage/methylation domain-containing protein
MKNRLANIKSAQAESGFGLIELLVSIVVLGIGIMSLITLVGNMVRADRYNTIDFTALNFAREGIEIARNTRDSNWLAGRIWDTDLSFGTDYTAILIFDSVLNRWQFDYGVDAIDEPLATLVYNDEQEAYVVNESGRFTPGYRRLLTMNPICYDEITETESIRESGESCTGTEEKIGVYVIADVAWTDGQTTRDHQLIDKIYNWR